jgi:hypothetical protein
MKEGVNTMVTKPVKTDRKKTSRGQRTHVRRMKQEARKGPIVDNMNKKSTRKIEVAREAAPTVEK